MKSKFGKKSVSKSVISEEILTVKKLILIGAYLFLLSLTMMGMIWLDISKHNFEKPISIYQIILFSSFFFFAIFQMGWLTLLWKKSTKAKSIFDKIQSYLNHKNNWARIFVINTLVFLGCVYLGLLAETTLEPFTAGILDRLQIIFFFIAGVNVSIFAVLLMNLSRNQKVTTWAEPIFYTTLVMMLIFLTGWFWLIKNGFEQESRITGWNPIGAPVLETQVMVAWLCGAGLLLLTSLLLQKKSSGKWDKLISNWKIDLLVMILLWWTAIILWQSTPLVPNWFLSEKRPPNFEYYPNSDAAIYDTTAQDQLVGEGFRVLGTPYVRRPLHAMTLAFIHSFGGQDYEKYIVLQVVILAFLPPLFYLLAIILHNRMAGVIIALIILLREKNSIALAGNITTSNAKVLLSDMLTFLVVMVFILAATIWIKKAAKPGLAPLLCGAALGLPILIRPETGSYAFVVLALTGITLFTQINFKLLFKSILLFSIGLGCILAPWIIRNYQKTGMIYLDSPYFFYEILEQRYTNPEKTDPSYNETNGSELQSLPTNHEITANSVSNTIELPATPSPEEKFVETVKEQTVDFLRNNPSEVIRFFVSHYLNSQIQSLLIMPTTFRPFESLIAFSGHKDLERLSYDCCSAIGYIRRLPFWRNWNGSFPPDVFFLLSINMALIAFGIQVAWKRHRWASLLPIFISLMHFTTNAFFRNSGGRYILPADWTGIFYFGIGISELTIITINSIQGKRIVFCLESPIANTAFSSRRPKFVNILLMITLLSGLGLSLPLFENGISRRYTDTVKNQMLNTLFSNTSLDASEKKTISSFLDNGGNVLAGRALYPRFYPKDQGEPGSTNPFKPHDFSRVSFYLAGPKSEFIVLPKLEKIKDFPNATDVLVFTCSDLDVLAVAVFESNSLNQMIWRSPLPDPISCPLEPNSSSP